MPKPKTQNPKPKKSLGQNFLVDSHLAARIVSALGPREDETIVEIGPGRGALTGQLMARAGRVVAVELDRELAPMLRDKFIGHSNFTVVEADALEVDFAALIVPAQTARVVANLPYNISTALLQHLLAHGKCLTEMVLMLQREVVERITAPPGHRERGFLSVMVEARAEAAALFDAPPAAFRPVPKVWSSVARLRVREHEALAGADETLFRQLASAGFAQRRKTIGNNLKALRPDAMNALAAAAIDPQRRAETLTLAEWANLARVFASPA
jgi:16S rRNA (adenine1518-N6/adenine1519-N6)-dimethyltransferase